MQVTERKISNRLKDNKEIFEAQSVRSFNSVLKEWYRFHENEIAESTAYRYKTQLSLLEKFFEDFSLEEITNLEINNFVVKLKSNYYSKSVIANYCKVISLCFKYAIIMGYVLDNPVNNACIPKVPRHIEIYPYSVEEVMQLLQVDYLQWVKESIMIAFHTGMREGEIFALKWSDINFEQQFIMVQRAQSKASSKVILKTPKSAAGIRRIDIDKYLTACLLEMKTKSTSKFVFAASNPRSKYEFIVPWNMSKHIKNMCMMAGIPPRTFHTFRHTHATILLAYGIHPKIVQERLGHSDISITMETYSHVLPTIQKEATRVFERICGKYYGNGDEGKSAAILFDNIVNLQLPQVYGKFR